MQLEGAESTVVVTVRDLTFGKILKYFLLLSVTLICSYSFKTYENDFLKIPCYICTFLLISIFS